MPSKVAAAVVVVAEARHSVAVALPTRSEQLAVVEGVLAVVPRLVALPTRFARRVVGLLAIQLAAGPIAPASSPAAALAEPEDMD